MIKRPLFVKNKLAVSMTCALLALGSQPISAKNFDLGGFEINFDSTFSAGSSWRKEDRDFNNQIGKSNHPQFNWDGYNPVLNPIYSSTDVWSQPGTYSNNGDAGNLNFDSGDTFSKLIKGTHDLDIRKDNFGIFTRFMYFYDFELMDENRAYRNPTSGQQVDPCADEKSRDQVCRDFRLLDAFVYADFDLNDGNNPLSVRLGQQVVNWGESTLISHGINVNPVDIDRLKAPGADLKEAFIPVGMLWASLGLTENVSVEAFYQYEWQETRLPVAGSYFSTNDFASENGYKNNVQLGFTSNPDIDLETLTSGLNSLYADAATAAGFDITTAEGQAFLASPQGQAVLGNAYLSYATKVALKGKGSKGMTKPSDGGQYGLKLAWYVPELNETEFSLYHINYHSRRPLISAVASDFTQQGLMKDLGYIAQNTITEDNVTDLSAFSSGSLVYPEDIKLYGLSFNTVLGETSFAGEFTYRQDEPLQIDDVELLYAVMPEQLAVAGIRPDFAEISQLDTVMPGDDVQGYVTSDTMQLQFTATHLFGPSLGADSWVVLAEVGGVTINDMPDQDELRLNVAGTGRTGKMYGVEGKDYTLLHQALSNGQEMNPFPSASAWGYRLVAKGEYNNVFAGVNISPRAVFSHDVNGITPDPMYLFIEDRKSLGLNLNFNYQNAWSLDMSYNTFWGGGQTNNFSDRDYVSLNIKYSI
jgi:hypothetical protein